MRQDIMVKAAVSAACGLYIFYKLLAVNTLKQPYSDPQLEILRRRIEVKAREKKRIRNEYRKAALAAMVAISLWCV